MNKEYILNKIKPYLDSRGMIGEHNYNKLFSMLNKQQQYDIINILIESDIEIDYDNFNKQKDILKIKNTSQHTVKLDNISNEQLCVIYQQGHKQALDALINNNIKLVWSRVKKYGNRYKHKLDEEDLLQYGIIGLMIATEKFDLKKDAKFSTYAIWWIDQRILRSIADYGFTVRLPVHYFDQVNKLLRVLGQNPGATKKQIFELVKENGMDRERFEETLMIIQNIMSPASLNVLVGDEEDSELGDFKVDDTGPTVEEQVEYNQLKETIELVLSTLTDKERDIMELRFGLKDGIDRTLEQVGVKYRVTRERIRQIEAKALRKLRHPSRSKKLKDFMEM